MQSTPAWLNEGETPLGSFLDLAGWQDGYEAEFAESNKHFRDLVIGEVGYDPDDLIQEHGARLKAINVQKELERQYYSREEANASREEIIKPVKRKDIYKKGTIKDQKRHKKERDDGSAPRPAIDRLKAGRRVKGYKAEWEARQKQLKATFTDEEQTETTHVFSGFQKEKRGWTEALSYLPLARRYTDTNEKITYENFLQRVQDPAFNPNVVGVASISDMVLGLLHKSAHWVPHNLTLNEHNLPAGLIRGRENHFKAVLEMLDDMPDIKANADRLHDLVYQPSAERYMERYHPNAGKTNDQIAKDIAGVDNFDDWSLPFKHDQNSVLVNHQIHTIMDFGFDEI